MRADNLLPPIILTAQDYDRLSRMAYAASRNAPEVADYLLDELERATVVDGPTVRPTIVTMGATVTYRDDQTGETRRVTLVYPEKADLSDGRMSVMTPVGAALIGMEEGHSIHWYTRSGKARVLTVLKVECASYADGGSPR